MLAYRWWHDQCLDSRVSAWPPFSRVLPRWAWNSEFLGHSAAPSSSRWLAFWTRALNSLIPLAPEELVSRPALPGLGLWGSRCCLRSWLLLDLFQSNGSTLSKPVLLDSDFADRLWQVVIWNPSVVDFQLIHAASSFLASSSWFICSTPVEPLSLVAQPSQELGWCWALNWHLLFLSTHQIWGPTVWWKPGYWHLPAPRWMHALQWTNMVDPHPWAALILSLPLHHIRSHVIIWSTFFQFSLPSIMRF